MPFVNINEPQQIVSFKHALLNPVGDNGGIYMPQNFPQIPDELRYSGDLRQISEHILSSLIQEEIPQKELSLMIKRAFNFPVKLRSLSNSHHVLELFHGPTLAFKDFGARFLAECLHYFNKDKITIVTATSGDTGAAVAHAFHGLDNIDVVVLYPDGKISKEQEQLFCTLGGNIHTIKVDGDFDACQSLVKQAFNNPELNKNLKLNSANSINIARLLAQICYYAVLPGMLNTPIETAIVPCGNFGNLTAGLIAKKMGVPINRFVAATNSNDTVPRYFTNKEWLPNRTVRTISNAMDVSQPNNFSRILHLYHDSPNQLMEHVSAVSINEAQTKQVIRFQHQKGYQVDPHTAVGIHGFEKTSDLGHQVGHQVVISTAHPAKFSDVLEDVLGTTIERPETITQAINKPNLSSSMDNSFHAFKNYLLALN